MHGLSVQRLDQALPHLAKRDGGEQARRAAGDGHAQEGGVHGADVGGAGGKQVVAVEVEQRDDAKAGLPAQPEARHHVHHLRAMRSKPLKTLQSA